MTTELTNEQIARVFAMYYGCRMRSTSYGNGLSSVEVCYTTLSTYASNIRRGDSKLLLTPLSAISDEDAVEVAKIIDFHDGEGCMVQDFGRYKMVCDRLNDYANEKNSLRIYTKAYEIFSLDSYGKVFDYDLVRLSFVHQFFIQRGYAVPLFIEPNHPLNGETAIELGIAIDKTREVVK